MPADRVNTCLRYICKATQFHQTLNDEKRLMGCSNNDEHKYCLPVHEYDEIKDITSTETICLEPEGYITMMSVQKGSSGIDTGTVTLVKTIANNFYVVVLMGVMEPLAGRCMLV